MQTRHIDYRNGTYTIDSNYVQPRVAGFHLLVENNKGIFVIRWEEREGIDREKFEQEKENARTSLMKEKQKTVYEDWIQSLRNLAKVERLNL